MKKRSVTGLFLAAFCCSATAQVSLPLTVTEDVFNADTVFIKKTNTDWGNDGLRQGYFVIDGASYGETVMRFNGVPGYLDLKYSRNSMGKSWVMTASESADGENFTEIMRETPSQTDKTEKLPLKKDTRYVKFYYTSNYKFGDVNVRYGYWKDIKVNDLLSFPTSTDTVNTFLGDEAEHEVKLNVAYSNPTGNVKIVSDDPAFTFADGTTTCLIDGTAGQEGSQELTLKYTLPENRQEAYGQHVAHLTLTDDGYDGEYSKTYTFVWNVKYPLVLTDEVEGALRTMVGMPVEKTFSVTSKCDAEALAVSPSLESVTLVSVVASEENPAVKNITVQYNPLAGEKATDCDVTVADADGNSVVYKLNVSSFDQQMIVSTAEDFNEFAVAANDGYPVSASLFEDITFTEDCKNVPISKFNGVLNGNRHTIKGVSTDDANSLFVSGGELNGKVQFLAVDNMRLLDSNISPKAKEESGTAADEAGDGNETTEPTEPTEPTVPTEPTEPNGLYVEYCYGTPSDTQEPLLMPFDYLNSDYTKYCFMRITAVNEEDPTAESFPLYYYKSTKVGAVTPADGELSKLGFVLLKALEEEDATVFGWTIGVDEMPSFATDENVIESASLYENVKNAEAKELYMQNGKIYDYKLDAFTLPANSFVMLEDEKADLTDEEFANMQDNFITKDGYANRIVLDVNSDYFFPAATGLASIIAQNGISANVSLTRNGGMRPLSFPFEVESIGMPDGGQLKDGDKLTLYGVDGDINDAIEPDKGHVHLAKEDILPIVDDDASNLSSEEGDDQVIEANTPFFIELANDAAHNPDVHINLSFESTENDAVLDSQAPAGELAPLYENYAATKVADLATADADVYTVSVMKDGDADVACFVKADGDAEVKPFANYFLLDKTLTDNGEKIFKLLTEDDVVDAIGVVNSELKSAGRVYNLNGQRVSVMRRGNVYIVNGKKLAK